ncbi:MAG: AarF/UbiB family protein [Alphaproteobacteria bacterium]
MFRTTRNVFRLLRIAGTLARHDALFPLEQLGIAPGLVWVARKLFASRSVRGRPGERLALACQTLGPSFIKLGQALSVRSDLIGEDIAADLIQLQDRLPAFPGTVARAIVARELGRPVDEVFRRFDDVPVAAASIAQVHFAETTDGEPVAVKVLRPTVEREIARDLDLMFWIAELVERTQPRLRRLKPLEVARTFEATVKIEMDLRMEAAAADELGMNFKDDPGYRTPRVDWDRTARRVLTMERVMGVRIDDREALIAAGHDPSAVLQKSAESFFFQVFRDGFFHADMHGGNAFVTADGTVVPIDFGIMGRLARKDRVYLAELLVAFLRADYYGVAEVQWRAGYVPPDADVELFAQACRSIGAPIFGKPTRDLARPRARPAVPGRPHLPHGGAAAAAAAAEDHADGRGHGSGAEPPGQHLGDGQTADRGLDARRFRARGAGRRGPARCAGCGPRGAAADRQRRLAGRRHRRQRPAAPP